MGLTFNINANAITGKGLCLSGLSKGSLTPNVVKLRNINKIISGFGKCPENDFLSQKKYPNEYKKLKKMVGGSSSKSIPLMKILYVINTTDIFDKYNEEKKRSAEPSQTQKVATVDLIFCAGYPQLANSYSNIPDDDRCVIAEWKKERILTTKGLCLKSNFNSIEYDFKSSCFEIEKKYGKKLYSLNYTGKKKSKHVYKFNIIDGDKALTVDKYSKINKTQIAKRKPSQTQKVAKKETKKTSSKKKNSSNKLPICMNPVAGAKSWYFIKEDGYCYKTLEIKLTNNNSLYNSYYKNIYNKKVYEGKIKVAKEDSLLDKLKSGTEKIINDISGDTQKKKIVKIVKPKIKIKNKQKKIITKPKSQFEQKVLAALELEKVNKVNCIINDKPDIFKGEKRNFCIKKSDIIKLGEFNDFEKFPVNMRKAAKGCKTGNCIRNAAGKNVYKLFVQKKEGYHSKHPGDIIYGMAWFELLYLDSLKKAQKALKRYNNNKMNALTKSKDMKTIYSLIKMNNGRIKMREALGLSLYDDLELVLKNHWLLGDFLNNDTLAVEKVALDPELKKRKLLLDKYKTTLSKYKKKLEEKNNNS